MIYAEEATMNPNPTPWTLNSEGSLIEFKVRHMMLSKVVGCFHRFEGSLLWSPEFASEGSASGSIQVASIDTRDSSRDRHLVGPDFFDASRFPIISFSSKKFIPETKTSFTLEGDLNMHGVTKSVALHCTAVKIKENSSSKNSRLTLIAATKILRKDYGLMWNAAIEAGGVLVGDEIEIRMELEFHPSR
jgi:polyisoprenoid-binding protein YceI